VIRRVVWITLLALVALPARAQSPAPAILARAFVVQHRPLADAADVVQPILSPDGSVKLQPRLRTLVVEDRSDVLTRVAALLQSFDLPPRSVEVTLSLFLGTSQERAGQAVGAPSISREVRGVLETLGDFTKWTSYEALGSRSILAVEGAGPVVADLSDDYRAVFTVDAVQHDQRSVTIKRFSLQRRRVDAQGHETREDLYTTGMVLPLERLQTVGAASDPGSKRALFLTLQVREK
jgi:type II/III secretion system protein